MKGLVLLLFVALGAGVGCLAAGDDVPLRVVMGGFGALIGVAIGGAAAGFGRGRQIEKREIPGLGMTSVDIAANYWRDRGRPPR
jgi:hypothetical protein